jgi:hypothetical protein
MTSIGVTNRVSAYNRSTEAHDWKRRSERLVRASGLPYCTCDHPHHHLPHSVFEMWRQIHNFEGGGSAYTTSFDQAAPQLIPD